MRSTGKQRPALWSLNCYCSVIFGGGSTNIVRLHKLTFPLLPPLNLLFEGATSSCIAFFLSTCDPMMQQTSMNSDANQSAAAGNGNNRRIPLSLRLLVMSATDDQPADGVCGWVDGWRRPRYPPSSPREQTEKRRHGSAEVWIEKLGVSTA